MNNSLYSFGDRLWSLGRYDEACDLFDKYKYVEPKCAFGLAKAFFTGTGRPQDRDLARNIALDVILDIMEDYARHEDGEAEKMIEWFLDDVYTTQWDDEPKEQDTPTEDKPDYNKLRRRVLIELATEKGDVDAMLELARRYHYVDEDEVEALDWYEMAYDEGNSFAAVQIGKIYSACKTFTHFPSAYEWFEKGANLGDAEAMYYLGEAIIKGYVPEKEVDAERAFSLWQQAAMAGNKDAIVQLAECYEKGIGTKKDKDAAYGWRLKAAQLGSIPDCNVLGDAYRTGRGVASKNATLAIVWYAKSAFKGDANGMCSIAKMYLKGDGVKKDAKIAKFWLKRAVDEDNEEAEKLLKKIAD